MVHVYKTHMKGFGNTVYFRQFGPNLLFFLGLFFHRNRSTCCRVRHPWLLDWTVGTRYQKNWETRLFFFRNIGIYFHRRYRVESESEIADWQGETSDPWLLDWIWENWDTTCPRLLFFLDLFFHSHST